MKLLPKTKKILAFSLVMNYVLYLLMRLLFFSTYESQLDIMVGAAVTGVSGVRSAFALYTHFFLGGVLKLLTTVIPWLNWHAIFLYLGSYIGIAVISFLLVRRTPNKIGVTASFVVSCFLGYECYVLPGLMKATAVLAVAGLMLLLDCAQHGWVSRNREVAVGCLWIYASMLSFSAFCIVMILGALAMLAVILCLGQGEDWKGKLKPIARFVGCLLLAAVLLHVVDDWSYRATGRTQAVEARNAMERIYGYGVGNYQDDYADQYGIDSAEFSSIKNGSFEVRGASTWDVLSKLSREHESISFATINSFFKTVPIGLFHVGIFYLFVVLLFFLFYSKWDHKKAIAWTEVGMLLGTFLVAYVFHAWGYGWVSFLLILPLVMPLLLSLEQADEKEYQYTWAYLVVLSVILYSNFSSTMVSSVREERITALTANLNAQTSNVIDLNAYLSDYSAVVAYPMGMAQNDALRISNGAYALLDGFGNRVITEQYANENAYSWIYNPSNLSVWDMLLED